MDLILATGKASSLLGDLPGSTQAIMWIGIVSYFIILMGIGIWSGKHIKDMKDFLVAGQRLPLWMATGTLIATWFGAGSSMGVCATVFSDGLGSVLADPFGASISLVLAGIFIVGMLRKLKCLTVTDIIASRFGNAAGIYASIWMIPVYIGWLAAQFLGMGTILHVITGMTVWKGTLIGAVVNCQELSKRCSLLSLDTKLSITTKKGFEPLYPFLNQTIFRLCVTSISSGPYPSQYTPSATSKSSKT